MMTMTMVGTELGKEDSLQNLGDAADRMMERRRIFIGGLGGNVTEDDLRKTFSSLGEVVSVDVVRTKGRSFAYLDFLPSSDKSLAKLFSMYNGCIWKGGKLRLEKAKEHYLHRLRREWEEDAVRANDAPNCNADASDYINSSEKPKKLPSDKMQLQMFFPKLKKVKSLALGGTGKHKYSFQRIEVPTLPINFCDCEEHSGPSLMTKEKPFPDLETAKGGIDEKELNIMMSVMNKLLERENLSKAELVNETENPVNSNDDLLTGEDEADHMTDEDNLIINIVAGEKDSDVDNLIINIKAGEKDSIALFRGREKKTIMANQHKPTKDIIESQKKKIWPHSKKRESPYSEKSDGNEIVSSVPETKKISQIPLNTLEDRKTELEEVGPQKLRKTAWRDLIGQKGNKTPFSISDIIPSVPSKKNVEPEIDEPDVPSTMDTENPNFETGNVETLSGEVVDIETLNLENHVTTESQSGQSKDLEKLAEALPDKQKEVSNKLARGAAWLHKSSWTQLVASTNNSPFCISQVLPNLTSEKQEVQNSTDGGQFKLFESVRSESKGECDDDLESKVTPLARHDQNQAGQGIEVKSSEKLKAVGKMKEVSVLSSPAKKNLLKRKQVSLRDLESEEACMFMRSADSMKEWKKAKAALSGSLKKKKTI